MTVKMKIKKDFKKGIDKMLVEKGKKKNSTKKIEKDKK